VKLKAPPPKVTSVPGKLEKLKIMALALKESAEEKSSAAAQEIKFLLNLRDPNCTGLTSMDVCMLFK